MNKDGQTDMDKLVGGAAEDVTKKFVPSAGVDKVNSISPDTLLPVKELPFNQAPVPFNITGGGNGG